MIEEMRSEGPLLVVDAGLSLSKGGWGSGAADLEQRRIKASLIAEAFALAGIHAMALGPAD
ncbi:MAG TPA: hypothetical protein ENK18_05305, partial [Deltaproteobacteria bacterium]|nr:hypothetical protein [Deltaproteobacteria bacterium]